MKRVSFEIAKSLKEVGYPQTLEEGYDEGYAITKVNYKQYDRFDATWYTYTAQPETDLIFSNECHYPENCGEFCVAPTYLEVWLWLWREKNIHIYEEQGAIYISSEAIFIAPTDPEDAIEKAIEYLVNNNLIK